MNGAVVYNGIYNQTGIDVSELNDGVYFVNIKTESHDVTRKIVKR